MSRIYFHSVDETAEVSGSERAYMGNLINQIAVAVFDPKLRRDRLLAVLPDDCYLKNDVRYSVSDHIWADAFRVWLSVSDGDFVVDKRKIGAFEIALNTAYRLGSDAIRLMARIHGQCEIHCWISGQDRAWVASVIDAGLSHSLFREDMGWGSVIDLLNFNNRRPVVLSYSVCDSFPSPYTLGRSERFNEKFYEMPIETQWRLAFSALKKRGKGLQICKKAWDSFYFGQGITAMNIVNKPLRVVIDVDQD